MSPDAPRFSRRTDWRLEPNPLSRAAERRRRSGAGILDLTESNPTRCGFVYDEAAILAALTSRRTLLYEPEPFGLLPARQAVAAYYARQDAHLAAEHVLLTAGSSEAYSHLFRLLADPGDQLLVPQPSYPLFEFLSRLHDLELAYYRLEYHGRWEIDWGSVEAAFSPRTRALLAVNPNNPTGSLLHAEERRSVAEVCGRRGVALIADEVFLDYSYSPSPGAAGTFAGTEDALTFTLNGLSKTAALPQMKLGWIAASGPPELLQPALARLEVILDTYLSVGTPVQHALGAWLAGSSGLQQQIRERCRGNLAVLDACLRQQTLCGRLETEAGWSVVLRLPSVLTDESWALELLNQEGVLVQPGHFFDFRTEGRLVLSLLTPPAVFEAGVRGILRHVSVRAGGRPG